MAVVLKATAVEQDLLDIWLYIARDNPSAADRLLDKIEQTCRLYAEQPAMGVARSDLAEKIRCFSVDHYVVFYQPLENGILVLLVIEGSRDVPPIIGQRLP